MNCLAPPEMHYAVEWEVSGVDALHRRLGVTALEALALYRLVVSIEERQGRIVTFRMSPLGNR